MSAPPRPDGFFSSDPEHDQLFRMMERVTSILCYLTVTALALIVAVTTLILVVAS